MSNFNIKIDLAKLRNARVTESKSMGKCVVIPVEDNEIFLSNKGAAYIDFSARELREERYGQTHFIKKRVSKKMYKSLTDEERKNIPIIGSLSPDDYSQNSNNNQPTTEQPQYQANSSNQEQKSGSTIDDLPF